MARDPKTPRSAANSGDPSPKPKNQIEFPITMIARRLPAERWLVEPLLFPELSRIGRDLDTTIDRLLLQVKRVLEEADAVDLHRRRVAGAVEALQIDVSIPPNRRNEAWREEWPRTWDYLCWQHGNEGWTAYVPALGIETPVEDRDDLPAALLKNIRQAVSRRTNQRGLRELVALAADAPLKLVQRAVVATIATAKQRAIRERTSAREEKSTLKETSVDLTTERLAPAFECDEQLKRLAETLGAERPRSVLLVGPSGCGKTALVHELVRRRRDFQLQHVPFWATSGSRLIAGASGFGMWQQRCSELVAEAAKLKAVIHFGNLVELLEVGKCGSSHGMAALLRPHFARGDLTAIVECTPEQLPQIRRQEPLLVESFYELRVPTPTVDQGRSILSQFAQTAGGRIETPAVHEIDRLHRRYATYSAYPGRPLRFLRNLLDDHAARSRMSSGDVPAIGSSDIVRAFALETGLPTAMLDDTEPLDLARVKTWFGSRIRGQPAAVELIIDLLATIKAGLVRTGRPIASLLLAGPTGVGKTETAKALSEFLYRDPQRMLRIDMSEYADPSAAARLIAGGPHGGGLLTTKIRERPFTVVLLDELEKAHPAVFDLLLQLLGEGRLTDANGQVADFTSSVVVMTSNLGADTYRRGLSGFQPGVDDPTGAAEHFLARVREFFRPELFNRIDRIVPYQPLGADVIRELARRQVRQVMRRGGLLYRPVRVQVDDAVIEHLAEVGTHIRYGARPLQRAVEQRLVAPLAELLNRYSVKLPLRARLILENGLIKLDSDAGDETKNKSQNLPKNAAKGEGADENLTAGSDAAIDDLPFGKIVFSDDDPDFASEFGGDDSDRTASNQLDSADKSRMSRPDSGSFESPTPVLVGERLSRVRRDTQRLLRSASILAMRNELTRAEQELAAKRRQARRNRKALPFGDLQRRIETLQGDLKRIDELHVEAVRCEERWLARIATAKPSSDRLQRQIASWSDLHVRLDKLLVELLLRAEPAANLTTLVIYSEDAGSLAILAQAYWKLFQRQKWSAQKYSLLPYRPELDPDAARSSAAARRSKAKKRGAGEADDSSSGHGVPTPSLRLGITPGPGKPMKKLLDAWALRSFDELFAAQGGAVGVAFTVAHAEAALKLRGEAGGHGLVRESKTTPCWVDCFVGPIVKYEPPENAHRKGAFDQSSIRRIYNFDTDRVSDSQFDQEVDLHPRALDQTLDKLLEHALVRRAWSQLDK